MDLLEKFEKVFALYLQGKMRQSGLVYYGGGLNVRQLFEEQVRRGNLPLLLTDRALIYSTS